MMEELLQAYLDDDFEIYDCHTHIGPYGGFHIPKNDKNALIEMMNLIKVKKIAVSAHLGITADFAEGNNIVLDAIVSFPDRVYGYACVNPNYDNNIDELDRMLQSKNIIGIKVHGATHETPINHEKYLKIYKYANEKKAVALIHTWGLADIKQAYEVVKAYPDVTFIIGHGGALKDAFEAALCMTNELGNAYIDTAVSMAYEGNIEYFVKKTSPEKILYGTDMPFYDPRMTLGRILTADIPNEFKKLILGYNLKNLTGGEML